MLTLEDIPTISQDQSKILGLAQSNAKAESNGQRPLADVADYIACFLDGAKLGLALEPSGLEVAGLPMRFRLDVAIDADYGEEKEDRKQSAYRSLRTPQRRAEKRQRRTKGRNL